MHYNGCHNIQIHSLISTHFSLVTQIFSAVISLKTVFYFKSKTSLDHVRTLAHPTI